MTASTVAASRTEIISPLALVPPVPGVSTPDTWQTMSRSIDCLLSYELQGTCDFIFLIHASESSGQRVRSETLEITPFVKSRVHTDARAGNRFLRLRADAGPLNVHYRAVVERAIAPRNVDASERSVADLPDDVLHNLMPTRYCESDHLASATMKIFGDMPPGYARVQAICDWIRANVDYRLGSTTATTTARDVFVQRAGVCRDFAHLAVTFCRALNIPARLVCGYVKFDEPPPDFHAIFEAYLGDGWMMFDPTGLAPVDQLIRIATGRDAKDVAFATIFGPARMLSLSPEVTPMVSVQDGKSIQPTTQVA